MFDRIPVVSSQIVFGTLALLGLTGWSSSAAAADRATFQDDLLPLIENHCVRCHNPDKRKGDLDLSTYNGAIKGGASGAVVQSGNPDSSKIFKAVTHSEEPTMPPNKPKLPDKELDVFRRWITSGLLETSGSKAVAASKPSIDLTLKATEVGKPKGPPPMPSELLREPVIHTKQANVVTGLAHSPWAPLVAVTGQKQVLLYHSETGELLGILPYPEGQPVDLIFSRNGKLLLAGGGHPAKSGQVAIWDVVSGARVTVVGKEYDSVLATDVNLDQSKVALGGPDRLVKIYAADSGEQLHKIKKHTDWVTALAFSPDGQILASGDRNGEINLWDPDTGQILFTLSGHKGSITDLSWRDDSKILASASEDGTIKWWETVDGKQVKTWTAHNEGVLSVQYAHNGSLVSAGRDKRATVWDASGNKKRSLELKGDVMVRAAFSDDGNRVVASDLLGRIAVWNAGEGNLITELDANPLPLGEEMQALQKRIAELEKAVHSTPSESERTEKLEAEAKVAATKAEATVTKAQAEQTEAEEAVKRLKDVAAGQAPPGDIDAQLAKARETRATARAATTNAIEVLEARKKDAGSVTNKAAELTRQNVKHLNVAREKLGRLKLAQMFIPVYQARESFAALQRELADATAIVAAYREATQKAESELGQTTDDAAKGRLKNELKKAKAEASKAEAAAKKIAVTLSEKEARLNKLSTEYERAKATSVPLVQQSRL